MEKIPGRIIRQMGFIAESRGLMERYIRVEGAWIDHLRRTREYIINAVKGKKFENLAVLGSGWLLDLPLEELVAISDHVWLIDAVHPAQVIHKLRKYRNCTAVWTDITGGCLKNAWQAVKQYRRNGLKATPENICNATFQPVPFPDYVISLDLLSQIGDMITDYLRKKIPYTQEEVTRIHRLLQQAHLDFLPPGKSCLVTDYLETNVDLSNGRAETLELLSIDLPDTPQTQTWEWQFDPEGNYRPGRRTILQVTARQL
jgi:hypothetical protein